MSASETETPVRYVSPDGIDAILIRIVRTALTDYRAGRSCPGKPSARDFLVAAGIVDDATGVIDWHGYSKVCLQPPTRKDN